MDPIKIQNIHTAMSILDIDIILKPSIILSASQFTEMKNQFKVYELSAQLVIWDEKFICHQSSISGDLGSYQSQASEILKRTNYFCIFFHEEKNRIYLTPLEEAS